MEISFGGLQLSAGTLNVCRKPHEKGLVLEKRQRAGCSMTNGGMLAAFLRMGNIFLHFSEAFDYIEEKGYDKP